MSDEQTPQPTQDTPSQPAPPPDATPFELPPLEPQERGLTPETETRGRS
jgi:hypothetical protein